MKIFGQDEIEIRVGDRVEGLAHGHTRNPNKYKLSGIVRRIDQYGGVCIEDQAGVLHYQIARPDEHGFRILGGITSDEGWGFSKVAKPVVGFVPQFQIFKEGQTTNGPVTITAPVGGMFDKPAKMEFYRSLGYTVTDIV